MTVDIEVGVRTTLRWHVWCNIWYQASDYIHAYQPSVRPEIVTVSGLLTQANLKLLVINWHVKGYMSKTQIQAEIHWSNRPSFVVKIKLMAFWSTSTTLSWIVETLCKVTMHIMPSQSNHLMEPETNTDLCNKHTRLLNGSALKVNGTWTLISSISLSVENLVLQNHNL